MDKKTIVDALGNTTSADAETRKNGEAVLEQMHKIIGYVPSLLDISLDENVNPGTRQAAVIYLKNMVNKYWNEEDTLRNDDGSGGGGAQPKAIIFTIHEQDRHVLRQAILPALITASEPVRLQLATATQTMLREDFGTGRWPGLGDALMLMLEKPDGSAWRAALTVLHKLAKVYEYRRVKEKEPLNSMMKIFLPVLYERMVALMAEANQTQEVVFLEKLVLKVLFTLVQHSLSFAMITKEDFIKWMEVCRAILERPDPQDIVEQTDPEDRPELVWSKCKKWAAHTLVRVFERYGMAGQTQKQYNQFADFYLKSFSHASLDTMLKLLVAHASGQYVAPRVLHYTLLYVQQGVSHSFTWKHLKPHMEEIIRKVVFPLLKHSSEDEELWQEDPVEYIREKFDIFDELLSPSSAAKQLLSSAVKRGQFLTTTVNNLILPILNNADAQPVDQDGALHMLGTVSERMLKKKMYKVQLEQMLLHVVAPRVQSPCRFLRSRACWCMQQFSDAPFTRAASIDSLTQLLVNVTVNDSELPVRVEAAIALLQLMTDQDKMTEVFRPHVPPFTLAVLDLIARTENDDLTSVMEKIVDTYSDEITPIAVEVATKLGNVFKNLLQNEDEDQESRALTAMGILNTLESVLNVMDENREIMSQLELIVLDIVEVVIKNSVMGSVAGLNFYEEVLSLVASLTTAHISPNMWRVYSTLHDMFQMEGMDFFADFMPALHNYLTVDTAAFLEPNSGRMEAMLDMCEKVLREDSSSVDVDTQMHAAKLLECILMQCAPTKSIGPYVPRILSAALGKLDTNVAESELRAMCLLVVIAAFYYDMGAMLQYFASLEQERGVPVFENFLKQWLYDTDCFLGVHDRKLCVLVLTQLMRHQAAIAQSGGGGDSSAGQALLNLKDKLLPACVMLLSGLVSAYQALAEAANDDSDEEEEELDSEHDDGLASDEDEIDDTTLDYIEAMNRSGNATAQGSLNASGGQLLNVTGDNEDDDDVDSDDDSLENNLEAYETPLDGDDAPDEFAHFQDCLTALAQSQPQWHNALLGSLDTHQKTELEKLLQTAEQRKRHADNSSNQLNFQLANGVFQQNI